MRSIAQLLRNDVTYGSRPQKHELLYVLLGVTNLDQLPACTAEWRSEPLTLTFLAHAAAFHFSYEWIIKSPIFNLFPSRSCHIANRSSRHSS